MAINREALEFMVSVGIIQRGDMGRIVNQLDELDKVQKLVLASGIAIEKNIQEREKVSSQLAAQTKELNRIQKEGAKQTAIAEKAVVDADKQRLAIMGQKGAAVKQQNILYRQLVNTYKAGLLNESAVKLAEKARAEVMRDIAVKEKELIVIEKQYGISLKTKKNTIDNLNNVQKTYSNRTTELSNNVNRLKQTQENLKNSTKTLTSEDKTLEKEKNRLNKQVGEESRLFRETNAALQRYGIETVKDSKDVGVLTKNVNQANVATAKFKSSLASTSAGFKNINEIGNQTFTGISRIMTRILTTMITLSTLYAFKRLIEQGAAFEHILIKIGAVAKASQEEFKSLSKGIREIARETVYTANEVSDIAMILAQAGFNTKEILNLTLPILKLTTATMGDLKTTTELVSSIMKTFNFEISETSRIVNVLTEATIASRADIEKIADAFKYAGPAGAAFNQSLETTIASLSTFIDMGLSASVAGTTFRRALTELADVTDKKIKVLQKLNLAFSDIDPTLNDFGQILNTLAKTALTTQDAITLLGVRAGPPLYALIERVREGTASIVEFTDQLADATKINRIEQIYNTVLQSMQSNFLLTKAEFEDMALSMFQIFKPALTKLILDVRDAFKEFNNELRSQTGKNFGELLQGIVPIFLDIFIAIKNTVLILTGFFAIVLKVMDALHIFTPILQLLIYWIGVLIVKHILWNKVTKGIIQTMWSASISVKDFGASVKDAGIKQTLFASKAAILGNALNTLRAAFNVATLSAIALQTVLTLGLSLVITALAYGIQKLVGWLFKSKEAFDDNYNASGQFGDSVEILEEKYQKLSDTTGILVKNQQDLNEAMASGRIIFGEVGDSFVAIGFNLPSFSDIIDVGKFKDDMDKSLVDVNKNITVIQSGISDAINTFDEGVKELDAKLPEIGTRFDSIFYIAKTQFGYIYENLERLKVDPKMVLDKTKIEAYTKNIINTIAFSLQTKQKNPFAALEDLLSKSFKGNKLKEASSELVRAVTPIAEQLGIIINDKNKEAVIKLVKDWYDASKFTAKQFAAAFNSIDENAVKAFTGVAQQLAKVDSYINSFKIELTEFLKKGGTDAQNQLLAKQKEINKEMIGLDNMLKSAIKSNEKLIKEKNELIKGGKEENQVAIRLKQDAIEANRMIIDRVKRARDAFDVEQKKLANIVITNAEIDIANKQLAFQKKLDMDIVDSFVRKNSLQVDFINSQRVLFNNSNEFLNKNIDLQRELNRLQKQTDYKEIASDLKDITNEIETRNELERNLLVAENNLEQLKKSGIKFDAKRAENAEKQYNADQRLIEDKKEKLALATQALKEYEKTHNINELNKKIFDLIVQSSIKINDLAKEQAIIQSDIVKAQMDLYDAPEFEALFKLEESFRKQYNSLNDIADAWYNVRTTVKDLSSEQIQNHIISLISNNEILKNRKDITSEERQTLAMNELLIKAYESGADVVGFINTQIKENERLTESSVSLYEKQQLRLLANLSILKERNKIESLELIGADKAANKEKRRLDLNDGIKKQQQYINYLLMQGRDNVEALGINYDDAFHSAVKLRDELIAEKNAGIIEKIGNGIKGWAIDLGAAVDEAEFFRNTLDQVTDMVIDFHAENIAKFIGEKVFKFVDPEEVNKEEEYLKDLRKINEDAAKKIAEIWAKFREQMREEEENYLEKMYDIRARYDDLIRESETNIYNERVERMMSLAALEQELKNQGLTSEEQRAELIMEINDNLAQAQIGTIEERQMRLGALEEQIKALNELENQLGLSRAEIEASSLARLEDLKVATSSFYTDKSAQATAALEAERTIENNAEIERHQRRIRELEAERDKALAEVEIDRQASLVKLEEDKKAADIEKSINQQIIEFALKEGAKFLIQYGLQKAMEVAINKTTQKQITTTDQTGAANRISISLLEAKTKVGANQVEAQSAAGVQAAKLPFPANLIAIGIAIATVASLFAGLYTMIKRNKGGMVEFEKKAGGGTIRGGRGGIDDIYTTLPAQSYVVNKQSARMHQEELKAMTAGGNVPVALTRGEFYLTPPQSIIYHNRLEEINNDRYGYQKKFNGGRIGLQTGGSVPTTETSAYNINVINDFSGVNIMNADSESAVSELFDNVLVKKIQESIDNKQLVLPKRG